MVDSQRTLPGNRPNTGGIVTKSHLGRRSRVVVVDPDDDSRDLYVEYLTWAGVRVRAVRTAADALRIVSRRPPDALITCLRLAAMDGFALCDALRTMAHTRRLPVIAVSTCRTDHDRAVRDMRFVSVLMKPCLPDILLQSLRATLAARDDR